MGQTAELFVEQQIQEQQRDVSTKDVIERLEFFDRWEKNQAWYYNHEITKN